MQRRRRHDDRAERDLKTLALKTGVIWPQTKECQQSLELEEERNGFSSRTSAESTALPARISNTDVELLASGTVRVEISLFSAIKFVLICYKQPQEMNTVTYSLPPLYFSEKGIHPCPLMQGMAMTSAVTPK